MLERPGAAARSGAAPARLRVILVNYNGGEAVLRCLRSLRESVWEDAEVVVVDNASTDGSAAAIEREYPEARLVRSARNRGFGAGCNLGARDAEGETLVFLNPDTTVEPGWLQALAGALERDEQAGLATAQVRLLDDPGRINTCGNEVHLTGLALCRGLGRPAGEFDRGQEVGAVSGAAFAIRRELFAALGGFDEDFFLYMEDTDLSLRARLAGFRCVYAPEAVVYHDYRLRIGPRKTYYQERNRYLILLKIFRWRTLLALSPALLLAEAITWGFSLARDRRNWANKLQAYVWVSRNLRAILEKRKQTQRLRAARDRELLAGAGYRLAFEQTGRDLISRGSHFIFDPLFFLLRSLALLLAE
jgi:GT2 family glycosyltransferase